MMMTIWPSHQQYEKQIIEYLEHYKNFNYILITEHSGTVDPHHHLYVQYSNTTTLDRNKLFNIHTDQCFGSPQSCIAYLRCQDKKHPEIGVVAKDVYENGRASLRGGNKIGDIKKMSDEEVNNLSYQMYNVVQKIRPPPKIMPNEWYKKVKILYYYGDTGLGKSFSVYHTLIWNNRNNEGFTEVKHKGQFWLGVSGEEVDGIAVYDDFRDSHMPVSEFINFIDYHVHNLNYKGGAAKNKFDLIIITSIQSPYEIYKNVGKEPRRQWLRRMKIINLDKININTHDMVQDHNHTDISHDVLKDFYNDNKIFPSLMQINQNIEQNEAETQFHT